MRSSAIAFSLFAAAVVTASSVPSSPNLGKVTLAHISNSPKAPTSDFGAPSRGQSAAGGDVADFAGTPYSKATSDEILQGRTVGRRGMRPEHDTDEPRLEHEGVDERIPPPPPARPVGFGGAYSDRPGDDVAGHEGLDKHDGRNGGLSISGSAIGGSGDGGDARSAPAGPANGGSVTDGVVPTVPVDVDDDDAPLGQEACVREISHINCETSREWGYVTLREGRYVSNRDERSPASQVDEFESACVAEA